MLAKRIFSTKEKIDILGKANKFTNMTDNKSFMFSEHRDGATGPAKYSAAAKILDAIFIYNQINALESDDLVYVQVTCGTQTYHATCDGRVAKWDTSEPKGYHRAIPFFMYAISKANDNEELKDLFVRVKERFNATKLGTVLDVLKLCDSFYYHDVKPVTKDVQVYENSLVLEEIKRSYATGLLQNMEILNEVEDLPPIQIIDDEEEPATFADPIDKDLSFIDNCKAGMYLVDYNWPKEAKDFIPPLDFLDGFVPNETFVKIVKKLSYRFGKVLTRLNAGMQGLEAIADDYVNSMMVGRPGTGKTTLARAVGAALGIPVYTVPLKKFSEEDEFQGKTKIVAGELQSVKTTFLKGYATGGLIVLEEINIADPGVIQGVLGQAVEPPFILEEDGYKVIHRHPLCGIVATMNTDTQGSNPLNEAFSSRMKQTYTLDDPKKEEFIATLMSKGFKEKDVLVIYNSYYRIQNYVKAEFREELLLNVTLRGCIGALESMEEGCDWKTAVRDTLVGKLAEQDLEFAEQVYDSVIKDWSGKVL